MKYTLMGIVSGVVAAAAYLILLFAVGSGLILSLCIGLAAYFVLAFLIFRPKKVVVMAAEGVTQDDLSTVLSEGEAKVQSIKAAADKITDGDIQKKVRDIAAIADSVFGDIKKDPKNVRQARKFISYYMDTTEYIVQRYIEVQANSDYIQNRDEMTEKIKNALNDLSELFKKLKSKLMEDDLFDLDTEIKLLEQTIKSEGI
jgi:5-bromo-4-chloroindolyl phosphate hydrolysis protein